MICQQHLLFIADRVITLTISDDEETPEQINLFFSYIPSFRQFTHLRTFTLSNIHSYQTLLKVTNECQYLSNLTRFNFYFSSFRNCQVDYQLILDNIWKLPKLKYCNFNIHIEKGEQVFCTPTKISSTLKSVNMRGYALKWNQINRLFEYTPRLKCFTISIKSTDNDDYIPSPLPILIDLSISVSRTSNPSKMISFFQNLPNLRRLNVNLSSHLINGHRWEYMIRNYLPKLKVFKLKMYDTLRLDQNIEERIDELINSFRSSFWINEHQWFVRCFFSHTSIHLYTLSEAFCYNDEKPSDSWRSTYPHDNQQTFYNNMTVIDDETFFDHSFPSDIRLHNIKHLCIQFPIHDMFWVIVSNLKRLTSLEVCSYTDTFQSQLQTLLDHAPHLRCLEINQDESIPLQTSLFKYTTASVRHLDLENYNHQFNEEDCMRLSHSPLGVQCEVLSVAVKNRESIIILAKNMVNLRALHIRYGDEKHNNKWPALAENNKDELVQWLKDCLPLSCLVVNDLDSVRKISIWI